MLYKHTHVYEKLSYTPDPFFAKLMIRNRLYGTICLSRRHVFLSGRGTDAYYLRYFTFRDAVRSGDLANRSKGQRRSEIREDVRLLMNGEGLEFKDELLLYAYLDKDNERSRRIIEEFGFHPIGTFNVITFARIFPKELAPIRRLKKNEIFGFQTLLKSFYNGEQFVLLNDRHDSPAYYVWEESGEIKCGAKVVEDSWEVLDLPGITGKIVMHVLPKIPLINRLFKQDYHFVFIESLYYQPAYEHRLDEFFESILKETNHHSAIICTDPRSKIYPGIDNMNKGLVHKILGEKSIDIVAKSNNGNNINDQLPVYVAGSDVL